MTQLNLGHSVLQITGNDALDFLQRLSTQDLKNLANEEMIKACFLQPTSKLISIFDVQKKEEGYLLIIPPEFSSSTLEYLRKMHFAENIEIEDLSSEIQAYITGESLSPCLKKHSELKHSPIEKEMWDHLQIGKRIPKYKTDFDENNLILELPLAHALSRDKGCYPGQEVVERVFTYGNVAKKLVEIIPEKKNQKTKKSTELFFENKKVGHVSSSTEIEWLEAPVNFAWVQKPHFVANAVLQDPDKRNWTVVNLPHSFEIKSQR